MEKDSNLSLLMASLNEFYKKGDYIDIIKSIINQENKISLRILDWFITNYSKKNTIYIKDLNNKVINVYIQYKLMLKSFSKSKFDPFCRKNKILFYYNDSETDYIETSCGQLCFFKWCFENNILDFVSKNLKMIEDDMKSSLSKSKSTSITESSGSGSDKRKRRQLSNSVLKNNMFKQYSKHVLKFD